MEKSKDKNGRLRLDVSVLAAVVLFVADLYVMINMPQSFLILAAITVLFLAAIYFVADSILAQMKEAGDRKEEQYDNIFKSEKASYLLLRKTFDDLSELIEKGNKSQRENTDEIIHAQKAVAKVSIGRNKENTDALMNSNDRVMEKIMMLEAVLSENGQQLSSEMNDSEVQDILKNQRRILEQLDNLRELLENVGANAVQAIRTEEPVSDFEERMPVNEEPVEEIPAEEEDAPLEDTVLEDMEPAEETLSDEVPAEEALSEETLSDEILPDEEPDLSGLDDIMVDTLTGFDDESPAESTEAEGSEEANNLVTPDFSDPGKVMSPEEIAALIANM